MTRLLAAVLLLLPFIYSCKGKTVPPGILKPEKMQAVMWDMVRADVFAENFVSRDSSKNKFTENTRLQKQILFENGISKEEYYNSLEYYEKQPVLFGVMLDSLSMKMSRERDKIIKAPVQAKSVN